jgi:hypothetical protein
VKEREKVRAERVEKTAAKKRVEIKGKKEARFLGRLFKSRS